MDLPGITHAEVLRTMQREIEQVGSKAQAARNWGISAQLLDFVLKRQRNIGPKLLKALGLKRTTIVVHRYERATYPETVVASPVSGKLSRDGTGATRTDPD